MCPVAKTADCKSVTKKHRRFNSCSTLLWLHGLTGYDISLSRIYYGFESRWSLLRIGVSSGEDN